jgi:prepilin-type N-terminal cleavage/methylation domain-containing protein
MTFLLKILKNGRPHFILPGLKVQRVFQSSQKAFSLLEILIALSIATLLWGSTGFLMISAQSKLRTVMRAYKIKTEESVNLQFQNDIHSAVKIIGLTPKRLSFELPYGKGVYEYSSGSLYREFKGIKIKSLENVTSNKWECLSEENEKNVNLDKCGVVLWSYATEGRQQAVYAVKKIS